MKFPFNEGDDYFTINYLDYGVHAEVVQSCWDDQSEEMYTEDSEYFATLEDALDFLAKEGIEFVKYYSYSTVMPRKLYLVLDGTDFKLPSDGKWYTEVRPYGRWFTLDKTLTLS